MSRKPLNLGTKSLEEKMAEIAPEVQNPIEIVQEIVKPLETKETPKKRSFIDVNDNPSVLERLNQKTKIYKRVGVDIIDSLDDEIEFLVNNTLKDIVSKKDIYNEALQIGFPIWKEKLKSIKK